SSIIFAASSSPARRVADALLRDLRDPRTLAQWAEFAGVAPRTLNDGFREATGMTLLQWRTTVRLQTARRLLAAGSTPSAAARSVGYRHLSQFSRDFTSRYGMRPREFAGER
ncbi:helix-turn-helix transcriptional regulator, partial [uncultured Corynebacterium sp.]|uniref:helix-turn-helix transcriptional regulator n=1 Tax=uncultured Corynebacterium sp. TaxID=159447 RepID=UPI0025EC9906